MRRSITEKVLELAEESGGVTPRDLEQRGISRQHLYNLHKQGLLERVARGLYFRTDIELSEYQTIAEVCKRVPEGVICLLSALQIHELTTQLPHQVWLAIGPGKRRPKEVQLPIRIVHFSGEAFTAGIEEREIEGVEVKVYNAPKTVADCFRFRNTIGPDVAMEALQDCRRQRKCTNDDLYRYAKIRGVWNVMRPYMEAIS